MPLAQHHQKMEMGRGPRAIFKIDAYDERFLSSSVVTCGIEILSAYTAKFSR
jgi:hypothetical protein